MILHVVTWSPRFLVPLRFRWRVFMIARNLMLFTFLMDDFENTSQIDLWSIFYDLYINKQTLDVIRDHATKLRDLSKDMHSWTSSTYNVVLRIVNTETLQCLNQYWSKYADFTDPDHHRYRNFRHHCEDFYFITPRYSSSQCLQMVARSFGPRLANALRITEHYTNHWWRHGTLEKRHVTDCNPLLLFSSTGGDRFSIHYRTNPLNAYHLASGITETTNDSPYYFPRGEGRTARENVLLAANGQFRLWCDAFRRAVKRENGTLRIRIFCGDAVNFCMSLKHFRVTKERSANFYSRPWSITPLALDGDDYLPDAAHQAPLTFNIIETSNISDEV